VSTVMQRSQNKDMVIGNGGLLTRVSIRLNALCQCLYDLEWLSNSFLADRTNGRPYATVLRLLSSSVVVCNVCFVAKWCVLEQKLLLTVYRKSYMINRRP